MFEWESFSKKAIQSLEHPQYVGYLRIADAEARGARLVTGRGDDITFYWLVSEATGLVLEVKFQASGPPSFLMAAEAAAAMSLQKTYDQVSRLSADLIERHLRSQRAIPALPTSANPWLNRILDALDEAVHQCLDIPFAARYDTSPIEDDFSPDAREWPNWNMLDTSEKLLILEEVIAKEVRPYIELDAGGITLVSLEGTLLKVSYEGACVTCYASTGSTLSAIQRILRNRVHPSIEVLPILSSSAH